MLRPDQIQLPSRSALDRAGNRLSGLMFGTAPANSMTAEEIEQSIQMVTDFRAAHAYPMQKIRYGLRSMIRSEGADELISQRLKRVPRIVRKLHRMGNSRLSSLQDIGGCRAIFASGAEMDRVHARIMRRWPSARERNYVDSPKPMGYRAIHIVQVRDGRTIEVQLRTRGQQQWAEAVEAADARHSLNLKDEDGPESMVKYFTLAAEVIHRREYGLLVDRHIEADFEAARQLVIDEGFYRG